MILYKIQDPTTGLFSTGGSWPRWTATGKTWTKLSAVKAHLSYVRGLAQRYPRTWPDFYAPGHASLVTFEAKPVSLGPLP